MLKQSVNVDFIIWWSSNSGVQKFGTVMFLSSLVGPIPRTNLDEAWQEFKVPWEEYARKIAFKLVHDNWVYQGAPKSQLFQTFGRHCISSMKCNDISNFSDLIFCCCTPSNPRSMRSRLSSVHCLWRRLFCSPHSHRCSQASRSGWHSQSWWHRLQNRRHVRFLCILQFWIIWRNKI